MSVKYYTTRELTEFFRVSRYSIHRAIQSGALPVSRKEGKKNLFSEEAVKRYINESSKIATASEE